MEKNKIFDYMADNAAKWINTKLVNGSARSYDKKLILEIDDCEFLLSDTEIYECNRLYEESLIVDNEKMQELGFSNFENYDDYCSIVYSDYELALEHAKYKITEMGFFYCIEEGHLFIYQNEKSLEEALCHISKQNKVKIGDLDRNTLLANQDKLEQFLDNSFIKQLLLYYGWDISVISFIGLVQECKSPNSYIPDQYAEMILELKLPICEGNN